jgi:hypothetical protein
MESTFRITPGVLIIGPVATFWQMQIRSTVPAIVPFGHHHYDAVNAPLKAHL